MFKSENGTNEQKKIFSCVECGIGFARDHHLKRHIHSVHEQKKPFLCLKCFKSFARKDYLKKHDQTHVVKWLSIGPKNETPSRNQMPVNDDLESKKSFACEKCDKNFTQKCHLKQHIMGVHEQKRPFCCQLCSKSFVHKGNLKQHIFAVHEKKKRFICEQCDKGYALKIDLEKHKLNHTVERQNQVSQENESRSCAQMLINDNIDQENAFFSSECGEVFSQMDELNRYLETHEYEAEECHYENEGAFGVVSDVIPKAEIYEHNSNILMNFAERRTI